jgi:tetratricopeptide (TPR) repeat protein
MEEYLLGVEVEPSRPEDALVHYENVLRERPESFWGNYRAAVVARRVVNPLVKSEEEKDAADYLERCIARRPENPSLRIELAGCLYEQHSFDGALEQCNKALELNPDNAEFYRSRAFIRGRLGQDADLRADIDRFELLTRRLGKLPSWRLRLDWKLAHRPDDGAVFGRDPEIDALGRRLLAADPEDVDLRTALASELQQAGRTEAALAEYDKILEINPDNLRARYQRGMLLYKMHRAEAERDLSYLLEHPRFEELLRESVRTLHAFSYHSTVLLEQGQADKALEVALRSLDYVRRCRDREARGDLQDASARAGDRSEFLGDLKEIQGDLHYVAARACAATADRDPQRLQQAAGHLYICSGYKPKYLNLWFNRDRTFDGQRRPIELLLARLRDGDE